jgi:hypothetical protein
MMRPLWKKALPCLGALLLAGALSADNSSSAGVSARWLRIVDDPRGAGMGTAGLALARGAGSLGFNPAGLLQAQQSLQASYLAWDEDIRLQRLAYGLPLGANSALGLRLDYVDLGTVETLSVVNGMPQSGASLHPYGGSLGAAYAASLGSGFSAGAEARGLFEDLGNAPASSAAADLGLRWAPAGGRLALGLSVLNAGTGLRDARLPLQAGLGAAWSEPLRADAELRGALDLQLSPEADEAATVAVGLEYAVQGVGAFRAGYRQGGVNSPSGPSAGFSLSLGLLDLDYAYSAWGGQPSNQLGLRLAWGGVQAPAAAPSAALAPAPTPAPVATPTPLPVAAQVATSVDRLLQAVDAQDGAASHAVVESMVQQAPELREHLANAVKDEGVKPSVFAGEFGRAETYLRTMTRLRHDDAYAWMALGTVLWYQDKDQEALDAYQRSYLLDPSRAFLRTRIEQLGGTVPAP